MRVTAARNQGGRRRGSIEIAPGLKLEPGELNQVRHHAVLGHGLAVQAIHAKGTGHQCGPAEVLSTGVPLIESRENIEAAAVVTRELNAPFLTAMLEGKYTDAYLNKAGKDAPKFTPEDLKIISEPVDFVGINVYKPATYVLASDKAPGYREIPFSKSHPKMLSDWLTLGPEVLYWGPKLVQSLWKAQTIYITENGCADAAELAADGTCTTPTGSCSCATPSRSSSGRPPTACP